MIDVAREDGIGAEEMSGLGQDAGPRADVENTAMLAQPGAHGFEAELSARMAACAACHPRVRPQPDPPARCGVVAPLRHEVEAVTDGDRLPLVTGLLHPIPVLLDIDVRVVSGEPGPQRVSRC